MVLKALGNFGDQPFWGNRIYMMLVVGPQPVPQKKFTAEKLAIALCLTVGDEEMLPKALNLGQELRKEDGPAKAAKFIDKVKLPGHKLTRRRK